MTLTRDRAVELACRIHGWMSRDELTWLYEQASQVPEGGTWVEVGTWKGRSAMAVGLGLSWGSQLVCVDNFTGNPESQDHWEAEIPGWLESNADAVLATLRRLGVVVEMWKLDSARPAYPSVLSGIDAVFIDASHTYDTLCADIRAWLPRLKPGGLLCGHDLHADFPDVERAVRDCLGEVNMALRGAIFDQSTPGVPGYGKPQKEWNAGTIWWWRKPR